MVGPRRSESNGRQPEQRWFLACLPTQRRRTHEGAGNKHTSPVCQPCATGHQSVHLPGSSQNDQKRFQQIAATTGEETTIASPTGVFLLLYASRPVFSGKLPVL